MFMLNWTKKIFYNFLQKVIMPPKKVKKDVKAIQKKNTTQKKKKTDPLFEIEGNQNLNKIKKLQFKKEKKERARKGK